MDVEHRTSAKQVVSGLKFPTGGLFAALFAAWIGLITLALVNVVSDIDAGFKTWLTLHSGIGPYSGKELLLLVAWFLSWPVLHVVLRRRELDVKLWFGVFLGGMLIATALMWPPVFEWIADRFRSG